jgi:hypothetical protein
MTDEMNNLFRALSLATVQVLKKRLVMTSGDRDCSRQLELSGPSSYHLVGQAFDAKLVPYVREEQAMLGAAAERNGYRWGGRFKGNYDDVHFDNGNRSRPGRCAS